jgi:hypothetical protein
MEAIHMQCIYMPGEIAVDVTNRWRDITPGSTAYYPPPDVFIGADGRIYWDGV